MPRHSSPITQVKARGRTRYRVTVDAPKAGGKRKQIRRTFDTRREAQGFLDKTRVAVAAGRFVDRSQVTFSDLAEEWLTAKQTTCRPNTHYGYKRALEHWPKPIFGDTLVQQVQRSDIERLVAAMVDADSSKRNVEYVLGLVRQVFDRALDEDLIVRNPAARVRPAGGQSKRPEAYSLSELRTIREAIRGDDNEAAFLLSLHGLRRSEVLGLTWDDIDLTRNTLAVHHSRVEIDGGRDTYTGAPKTARGRRTLPLPDDVVSALKRLRREQQETFGLMAIRSGPVVLDELGQPLRPERYSDYWKAMLAEAGIRYLDLRAARRSSVTGMRDQGIPDHIVAAWHGHDEAVMRRNYSVAMDDGLEAAGRTLSQALGS